MNESKLPDFESLAELVEFFDTHDMGEYHLLEATFDVHIEKRSFLVAVDRELMKKLSQVARARQTSTEALVNAWLQEKVVHAA